MTEGLDLVTHVLQQRDDGKWRIVSKDELEDERAGLITEDEDDWSDIRSGHRGGGDHYRYGFVADGVPERVQLNDDENVRVHVLGDLWAAASEERISTFAMVIPGRQPAQRRTTGSHPRDDIANLLSATRVNAPDTPIGRILAVVLDDLEATAPGVLRFDPQSKSPVVRPGMPVLVDSTRRGTGIVPEWADEGADALILVADAVQEAAIEALWGERRSPVWPPCPEHSHPLAVSLVDDLPTWICPSDGHPVARIGELGR